MSAPRKTAAAVAASQPTASNLRDSAGVLFDAIAEDAQALQQLLDGHIRSSLTYGPHLIPLRALVGRMGCLADMGAQAHGRDICYRHAHEWLVSDSEELMAACSVLAAAKGGAA